METKRTPQVGTGRTSEQRVLDRPKRVPNTVIVRTLLTTLVASGGSTNWR
jgi:hypothetical protein